jgi:hypothetical protein
MSEVISTVGQFWKGEVLMKELATPRGGDFFIQASQKIYARLLTFDPTPHQLSLWVADPSEIDKRTQGTEFAALIDSRAKLQRAGVFACLRKLASDANYSRL